MTGRQMLAAGVVSGALAMLAGRHVFGHWTPAYAAVGAAVSLACLQLEIVASLRRRAIKAESVGDRYQRGYDHAKADTAAEIMGGDGGSGVLLGLPVLSDPRGRGASMCPSCRVSTMNAELQRVWRSAAVLRPAVAAHDAQRQRLPGQRPSHSLHVQQVQVPVHCAHSLHERSSRMNLPGQREMEELQSTLGGILPQAERMRINSLRDEFAKVAMTALLGRIPPGSLKDFKPDELGRNSYRVADAMMRARSCVTLPTTEEIDATAKADGEREAT